MRLTLNYRTRIIASMAEVGEPAWNGLLALQADANPFLSYAFLHALHESGSASRKSGWRPHYLTLWQDDTIAAALPLYLKSHSYGEYVFDWAWADAYHRNGLDYYPKLLCAIPFTPVAGPRLLAVDDAARAALIAVSRAFPASFQQSARLHRPVRRECALVGAQHAIRASRRALQCTLT